MYASSFLLFHKLFVFYAKKNSLDKYYRGFNTPNL